MSNKLLLRIATSLLIIATYSCNQSPSLKDEKHKASKTITKVLKQDNIIDFPCAVLVLPSAKTIALLRRTSSEDEYNTIVDDNQYYRYLCNKYLDSVKIRKIKRETEGSITFKNFAGKTFKVQLDSLYWEVILFNGKSAPINADMTMIENDYNTYMKQ
ncbi:MAG: hypothetical protein EOP47_01105 [Sphingobacteriaceae bacterium]|nr:MAG: hypothetical protein EOP47_01105 [Sphingobacteriaceae bacterium]